MEARPLDDVCVLYVNNVQRQDSLKTDSVQSSNVLRTDSVQSSNVLRTGSGLEVELGDGGGTEVQNESTRNRFRRDRLSLFRGSRFPCQHASTLVASFDLTRSDRRCRRGPSSVSSRFRAAVRPGRPPLPPAPFALPHWHSKWGDCTAQVPADSWR